MSPIIYKDVFSVSVNHIRSINTERDAQKWRNDEVKYSLTPLAVTILHQVMDGILRQPQQRAFSITGIYGTGKSAFVMTLAHLLVDPLDDTDIVKQIRQMDPSLYDDIVAVRQQTPRFLPVLISGHREPLLVALKRALAHSLAVQGNALSDLVSALDSLPPSDAAGLVSLYEKAAAEIGGLVLVVDEFGKFLEYAAANPDEGDIFVLQLLAEAAARSDSHPLLVFTVLHQSFAAYGLRLSQSQRDEWNKIQGRFLDIPFNQSQDVLIRLLAQSIVGRPCPALDQIRAHVQNLAQRCTSLGLRLSPLTPRETVEVAVEAAPIHPLALFVFGPYFRRLAQNERSLYAFLGSTEPSSFRFFLEESTLGEDGSVPLYGLPQLYDFIQTTLGPTLLGGVAGRNWILVEETLSRLGDEAPLLDINLIKSIGLISALGNQINLKADAPTLALALDLPPDQVNESLQRLSNRKLIVFRHFAGTYRLWEGSDFDLETQLTKYRSRIDEALPLADLLSRNLHQAPLEAKRHSFETGTLRVFSVRYADPTTFSRVVTATSDEPCDGAVIYLLTPIHIRESELEALLNTATVTQRELHPLAIIRIPVPETLRQAALELARLRLIARECHELETDRVARREVDERIEQLESYIQAQLDALLAPTDRPLICWYVGTPSTREKPGTALVSGRRDLNRLLSKLCDEVYHAAPRIRNELVNRRALSSQGAAARRELLALMVTKAQLPQLGIEKAPPHLSMYRSILQAGRLHVVSKDSQTWHFVAPSEDETQDPLRLYPTWQAFESFLESCTATRRPVSEFWSQLQQPPYGIREGVIPVLFVAMLLVKAAEVGVYENGNFVADLQPAHLERMVKHPDKFEVRYSPLTEARQELFDALGPYIAAARKRKIVPVVKALVLTVANLPEYAKKTKQLSLPASRMRDALLHAREPDRLLFHDIPVALGFAPLEKETVGADTAAAIVKALIAALRELNMAYGALLERIFEKVQVALRLPPNRAEALIQLEEYCRLVPSVSIDLRLKGFINHLQPPSTSNDYQRWIESLASFVASRPPATWNDNDETRFAHELKLLSDKLHQVQEIALTTGKVEVPAGTKAIRVGLTNQLGEELHRVVLVRPSLQKAVPEIAAQLADLFNSTGITDPEDQLGVLALLAQDHLARK